MVCFIMLSQTRSSILLANVSNNFVQLVELTSKELSVPSDSLSVDDMDHILVNIEFNVG
jgi:hypothetical protein